ncbi:hypothetical protein JCM19233_2701 [Vibrio astriarenae]|nr:hypothetical protein JCM19233_2701 [Vibrio sp. C7]
MQSTVTVTVQLWVTATKVLIKKLKQQWQIAKATSQSVLVSTGNQTS